MKAKSAGLLFACLCIFAQFCPPVLAADSWKAKEELPAPRSDFVTIQDGHMIFVLGGCSANDQQGFCSKVEKTLFRYDSFADEWVLLSNAPTPRYRYMAALYEGEIFYAGGRDVNDTLIQTVDVYNIQTNSWRTLPSTQPGLGRSDGWAFILGSKLYVTGGYDADYKPLANTVELQLNARNPTFVPSRIPDRAVFSGDVGGIVQDGLVYVFGGFGGAVQASPDFCNPLKSLEVYDPKKNTWQQLAPIPHGVGDMGFTIIEDNLFLLGGEDKSADCLSSKPIINVQMYKIKSNTWSQVASLESAQYRLGAASEGSSIFTFGGQGAANSGIIPVLDSVSELVARKIIADRT